MRNLALQAEVRHRLPISTHKDTCGHDDDGNPDLSSKIIAVIPNTNSTYLHIRHPNEFGNTSFLGNDGDKNNQPPSSFVVTSTGMLHALDGTDQLIWVVDLEKVVADSTDDDDDDDQSGNECGDANMSKNESNERRSLWFYASSFLQESSPDMTGGDYDGIMGMNLASGRGLFITCLSHAGYVVSVSIDETNAISSKGGNNIEDGSECIGIFENGLECGGWSPDGEVLALVTFASDANEEGNAIITFNET